MCHFTSNRSNLERAQYLIQLGVSILELCFDASCMDAWGCSTLCSAVINIPPWKSTPWGEARNSKDILLYFYSADVINLF